MDAQALINLEIFENNDNHSATGSLFNHIDHCSTKCGQRLLRELVCSPLQNVDEIERRLDSVDWISSRPEFLGKPIATITITLQWRIRKSTNDIPKAARFRTNGLPIEIRPKPQSTTSS